MASTTGWDSDDFQAGTVGNYQSLNNGSGFNAFPGGLRYNLAPFFSNEGGSAFFWSSTENTAISVWNRSLTSTSGSLGSSTNPKQFGFSVRFVRD